MTLFRSRPWNKQTATPTEEKKPMSSFIRGVDVSHYTKGVNWDAVAKDGNRFAFAKAGDGLGSIDSEFKNFRRDAKSVGLLFGAYFFFRFDHSVTDQVNLFLSAIGDGVGEIQPVLDAEWDRYSQHYGEGKTMDDEAASRVKSALSLLVGHGFKPQVYTNAYFFTGFKNTAQFENYPLWISNYSAKTLDAVKIPKPWKQATWWQYKGDVPGYGVDKMDFNYFLSDEAALKAMVKA